MTVIEQERIRTGGLLTIDVSAVVRNWDTMRRRMGNGRDCGAVVKADCYGLGATQIAPALARRGCRVFFVAMPGEGIALRRVLPDPDVAIHVLTGPLDDGTELTAHHLTPVLNTPEQLADWQTHAPGRPFTLHVDTGMNRLGMPLSAFMALPDSCTPAVVMSHLACADEPGHPLNALQQDRFATARARFPGAVASLSNSAGMFRGDDFLFDLGRPGIALYGGNPVPGQSNPMHPVVRLDLRVLQVREIDTAGTVGYGATRPVTPGMRLAIVAAGYADGLLRTLGDQGSGTIHGARVPILGRVSMDLITFDISALPAGSVHPGDYVTVLDAHHGIDSLAAEAGTLGYEILTGLSGRYTRTWTGS
ncbi:alanine racemase [Haematospirillum sp. H1815]|uniref:alanine racemase n=1 Tax=Haematospirillum sp. H1815 TaxID=2723108 RepID=UPI00143A1291|nr:alanine racemase [Haematospirillum sp. H1815]NKD76771.1 alanine racemase [Haematospirillum sp. H1815]